MGMSIWHWSVFLALSNPDVTDLIDSALAKASDLMFAFTVQLHYGSGFHGDH